MSFKKLIIHRRHLLVSVCLVGVIRLQAALGSRPDRCFVIGSRKFELQNCQVYFVNSEWVIVSFSHSFVHMPYLCFGSAICCEFDTDRFVLSEFCNVKYAYNLNKCVSTQLFLSRLQIIIYYNLGPISENMMNIFIRLTQKTYLHL